MNFNMIGKTLVFLHLIASVTALSWAGAVFMQFTDWGWKEPRKELDYRVPSEYDKRAADLADAQRARDMNYGTIKPAQADVRDSAEAFVQNHLWYREQLVRLKSDPSPMLEIKQIKYADGRPVLDPDTALGKPVLEAVVPLLAKSYTGYLEDFKKALADGIEVNKETIMWVESEQEVTRKINGLDEKDKRTRAGLYDLLEDERRVQASIDFEKDYLRPLLVKSMNEAEIYGERKIRLEQALDRVIKARPK